MLASALSRVVLPEPVPPLTRMLRRPATAAASELICAALSVPSATSSSGPGRTYVAAAGVPLLALGAGPEGPGPGGTSAATLALTKAQALRLIAAESFARRLTLLPEG